MSTTNFQIEAVSMIIEEKCIKWEKMYESAKQCLKTEMKQRKKGNLWNDFSGIVGNCGTFLKYLLDVQFLPNKDDVKGFISRKYSLLQYI